MLKNSNFLNKIKGISNKNTLFLFFLATDVKIHHRRRREKKNNNDDDKVMGNPIHEGKTIRNVKKSCHVERDVKIAYWKLLLGIRIIRKKGCKVSTLCNAMKIELWPSFTNCPTGLQKLSLIFVDLSTMSTLRLSFFQMTWSKVISNYERMIHVGGSFSLPSDSFLISQK